MKKVKFLFLTAFVAVFAGCQSEEMLEKSSENDKTTPTGDIRITIKGKGMTNPATRATDGKVEFEGGYATGAGLYNGTDQPVVEAHPDGGYEVSYFYGGPTNEPKKYDYSQSGTSLFEVDLGGQDHTFHCGFKEKKRNLTVNAGTGGSVSPSGTNSYRVKKPIDITATPDNGYEFTGWTITEGDVTINDPSSLTTTATLHNTNSTITANFEQGISISDYIFVGDNGVILSQEKKYILGETDWYSVVHGNGQYIAVGKRGYMTTSTDGITWTGPDIVGYSSDWYSIIFADGKYVAAGNGYVAVSTGTGDWNIIKISNTKNRTWNNIQYCNGRFIVVGNNGYMATSTDGNVWQETKIGSGDLKSVTYGNGIYVIAEKSGYINNSTDLTNWNRVKITATNLYSSAFGNNKFIVSSYGYMHYSTDGINWKEIAFGDNSWEEIIFKDDSFLTLENNGYIGKSIDGINWKSTKITDNNSLKLGFLNGFCDIDRK